MSINLVITRTIAAPPADVWAVVSDYPRDPEWRTGVSVMDASGPTALGVATHEVLRLLGRTYVNDAVIDSVEPGRRLAWHTVAGAEVRGSRTVEAADGGCRVTLEVVATPHGVERLAAPLLRRVLAGNLRGDLDRLAAVLGAGDPVRAR